jgi:predicted Fe-Mo cluster-binding NifX family protein
MKIAVSSAGQTLDDSVDARLGRCAYFLVIDPDTLEFEPIQNPNIALGHGAGIQSAQLLANKGVAVVLTGNCGPNAFQTFGAAGIQVITGVTGQVREAVRMFKSGAMASASGPSVQGHFGMGMGQGAQNVPPTFPTGGPSEGIADKKVEIASLKEKAETLKKQMEQITDQVRKLEGEE